MRFQSTEKFSVEELLLDEGNYRFRVAENQKKCIEKIYNQNSNNFRRLMQSIGENDIAQPLIVYKNGEGQNIVMDGNRRLAVLKVLYDADKYYPDSSLINMAKELKAGGRVDFSKILAMCSDDKDLIDKTIYDIHAAGGGVSQIGWNAYANAVYRYNHNLEKGKKWYPTAILLELENTYSEWTDFLTGERFYETFERIFNAAIKNGIISDNIFSSMGLNKSIKKDLLDDSYGKAIKILDSIKNKEINLSRKEGGIYASKAGIETYLQKFTLAPDKKNIADITGGISGKEVSLSGDSDSAGGSEVSPPLGDVLQTYKPKGITEADDVLKSEYGINRSSKIEEKLKKLNSKKLVNLYDSLCKVSLRKHPELLYVGAWSFFEALARLLGSSERTSFPSFLDGIRNKLTYSRDQKREVKKPIADISDIGDLVKHSSKYYRDNALQLRSDFETLEFFIIDIIDLHIKTVAEEKS